MRNTKKHAIFAVMLFFAIILSNITIVSAEDQEALTPYDKEDDEEIIYKTLVDFDFTKKIPMPSSIQVRIVQGISGETQDWVNELKTHVNDIVRFKITIQNTLNYNMIDVNFVNTLPADTILQLLEETITHDETVSLKIEGGKLTGVVNDLKIGEQKTIEYDMEALVETEITGVTSSITTQALFDPVYEQELIGIEETINLKKDVLQVLTDEIYTYKEKLIILDGEIDQTKIEEQTIVEKINSYDYQLNDLITEKNIAQEKDKLLNDELTVLLDKKGTLEADYNDIIFAISDKEAFIASKEAELIEQEIILKTYSEELLNLKDTLEVAYADKEANEVIIADISIKIETKEKELTDTLAIIDQTKIDMTNLEKQVYDLTDKKIIIQQEIDSIDEQITKNTADLNLLKLQEETLSADITKISADIKAEKEKADALTLKILDATNMIADYNENIINLENQKDQLENEIIATNLLIDENNEKINSFLAESEAIELKIVDLTNQKISETTAFQEIQDSIYETQILIDAESIYLSGVQDKLAEEQTNLLILKDNFKAETIEKTVLNTELTTLEKNVATTENILEALKQEEALLIQEKIILASKIDESIILQNKLAEEIDLTIIKINLATQDLNAYTAESEKIAGEILVLEGEIATTQTNLANVKTDIVATTASYDQNELVLNDLNVDYTNYQSVLSTLKYNLDQETQILSETNLALTSLKESIVTAESTLSALETQESSLIQDSNSLTEKLEQLETLYAKTLTDIELTQMKIDSKLQEKQTLETYLSDLKNDLTLVQQDAEEYNSIITTLNTDILTISDTISSDKLEVAILDEAIYQKETLLEKDTTTVISLQTDKDTAEQDLTILKAEYTSLSSQPLVEASELEGLELQINAQTALVSSLTYDIAVTDQRIIYTMIDLESDYNTNQFLSDEIAILEAEIAEKQTDELFYEQKLTESTTSIDDINAEIAETEAKILTLSQEAEALIAEKTDYEQYSEDTTTLISETQNLLDANAISLADVKLAISNTEAELSNLNNDLIIEIQASSAANEEINTIIINIQETEGIIAGLKLDINSAEATSATLTENLADLKNQEITLSNTIIAKQESLLLKTQYYNNLDTKIKDTSYKINDVLIPQKIDYESQLAQVESDLITQKLAFDEKIIAIAETQESIKFKEDELTLLKQDLTLQLQAVAENDDVLTKILGDISTYESLIAQTKLDLNAAEIYTAELSDNYNSLKLDEKLISDTIKSIDEELLILNTQNLEVKSNIDTLEAKVISLTDSKTLAENTLLTKNLGINQAQDAIISAEADKDSFIVQKAEVDNNILLLESAKEKLIADKTLVSASIYDADLLIKTLTDDKVAKENDLVLIDSQIGEIIPVIEQNTADLNAYTSSSEAIESELLVLNTNLLDLTLKSDALQTTLAGILTYISVSEDNINKQTLFIQSIVDDLAMVQDESIQLELSLDKIELDISNAETEIIAQQNLIDENNKVYDGIILDMSSIIEQKTLDTQKLDEIKITLNEKIETYNVVSDTLDQKEYEFYTIDEEIKVLKYKVDEEITNLKSIQIFDPSIVTIYVDTNPFNVLPQLSINKKAYYEDSDQWVDALTVYNDEIVRFSITVENIGDVTIPDIIISDVLPEDILSYIPGSSNIIEPTVTRNILNWNFESIAPGETIYIEFSTSCINTGTNDNYAFVKGEYPIAEFNTAIDVSIKDNVTISVLDVPINIPPEAVDDYTEISEDSTDNIIDVLSNDVDSDENDVLSIDSIQIQPQNGTAYIEQEQIIYTPNADFYGEDHLVYRLADNNGSFDTASVYITITDVNDNPVALDDNALTIEDTPITIDVLENDYDIDDIITIEQIVENPLHGQATITSQGILYTPDTDYDGSDNCRYRVSDGRGGFAEANVSITINDVFENTPPVADDDNYYISVNSTYNILQVLENDYDLDGHSISIVSVDVMPANGDVSIESNSLIYTPDAGFSGIDSLTYNITDGMNGFDTAVVTFNVIDQTSILLKPVIGSFYLWDDEIFNSATSIMESFGCDAFAIGPITITVDINESEVFDVDFIEFYLDNELIQVTSNSSHSFVFDERVLGFYTLKVVVHGEERTISEELEIFMINFGFCSQESLNLDV